MVPAVRGSGLGAKRLQSHKKRCVPRTFWVHAAHLHFVAPFENSSPAFNPTPSPPADQISRHHECF